MPCRSSVSIGLVKYIVGIRLKLLGLELHQTLLPASPRIKVWSRMMMMRMCTASDFNGRNSL